MDPTPRGLEDADTEVPGCRDHAEINKEEAEIATSLMQYEHHAESSYHGSAMGHSFVQSDREECHDRMMKDYFIEHSRYPPHDFQRWCRMRRELFESILNTVVQHDHYFARKIDGILANGCSAGSTNEYLRLAESTAIENLKHFCKEIATIYGATYLKKPNCEDLKRLLHKKWKNYPTAWAGQFKSHHNKPTIILEVVASYDTWIWHAFFDTPGSNNDINKQEPYMKDVERAFGILQARWAIVRGAARLWNVEDLH
ncbi:unnamed protein product [Malus baccata var. baccata]